MATKISIFKTTADGEQVNCEFELDRQILDQMQPKSVRQGGIETIKPGLSLRQIFAPYFQLVDDRLLEMNNRIMASNVLVHKLTPEAQYAFRNVMEVLTGRSSGPAPEEILKQERADREAAAAKLAEAKGQAPE